MAKGIPKSGSSAMSLVRDVSAVGLTLFAGSLGREIGSLAMLFVAPKIAKSDAGSNFAQGVAGLTLWDNVFSRFGKEVV